MWIDVIGIEEAAKYLGVSVKTLYSWVHQRKIPFVKVGRLVKFIVTELDKWILNNAVKKREDE